MRNTIALCACITALPSNAQVNGFDSPSSRWYVAETSSANTQAFLETWTTIYGMLGDTMIAGQTWRRIASSPDPTLSADAVSRGYLRREGAVILYRAPGAAPDTLYDFDALPGDSVRYMIDGTPAYLHLTFIDTVVIGGNQHRRFSFANLGAGFCMLADEQWIEGIGSMRGPLFPFFAREFCEEFNESMSLTCFEEGGVLHWSAPGQASCVTNIMLGAETPDDPAGLIHLWPNPGFEQLNVSWSRPVPASMILRDPQGRILIEGVLQQGCARFDASELAPGMYSLQLMDAGGLQAAAKWIKL